MIHTISNHMLRMGLAVIEANRNEALMRSVGMGLEWMGWISQIHEKSGRIWKERLEGTKGRDLQ